MVRASDSEGLCIGPRDKFTEDGKQAGGSQYDYDWTGGLQANDPFCVLQPLSACSNEKYLHPHPPATLFPFFTRRICIFTLNTLICFVLKA